MVSSYREVYMGKLTQLLLLYYIIYLVLQHFVWQTNAQSVERVVQRREEIASEMADIAILLMEFADVAAIPLGDAVAAKLARNEERYPAEKAFGSNKKYNEL